MCRVSIFGFVMVGHYGGHSTTAAIMVHCVSRVLFELSFHKLQIFIFLLFWGSTYLRVAQSVSNIITT